jgi:outer membrane receptor for ferric coprogen and ferric-rhodotorulic acid
LPRVTTVFGGRWTNFSARSRSIAPSTPTDWAAGAKADWAFTPYGGAVLDITRDLSAYGSYSEIFVPQTQRRVDGSVLDPRIGHQWEFGAKGEHLSGRLLTSLAVFDIRDRNRAYVDVGNPGFFVPLGEVESKGWETEVTGRLASSWDVSAGYTSLDTTYLVDASRAGQPLNYWYPKHSLKAWTGWRIPGGALENLKIGAGVQAYSKSASGTDTINAAGVVTVAARRQTAYAVVSANLTYPVHRHLQLTAQVNNLFDRAYYTRLGGTNIYNTFGDPRNVMISLRWQSAAVR